MSTEFDTWVERARAVPIESEIVRRGVVLRKSGSERIGPCPRCGGTDRFSINVKDNVWNCRQCKPADISGDIIGLVEWLDSCEFVRACETLNHEPPPLNGHAGTNDGPRPREVAWYDYLDEAGTLLSQAVRFDPKDFRQRKPGKNGGWDWSVKGVRSVPYHLPELIEAVATERQVFIVEGEKDVETMERRGFHATCNAMGAGKWRQELNQYFRDADVVIIADHDPPSTNKKTGEKLLHPDGRVRYAGFDHAMDVAAQLKPVVASVRMFDIAAFWEKCPEKGDITDYFENGGTVDALNDFVARLEGWSPGAPTPGPAPTATLPIPIIYPFPIKGSEIPRRPWIIPGLLLRRQLSLLVSPPGSGKSLMTLQLGMVCSAGQPWNGWRPRGRYRVLVINSEDDHEEMTRRLYAAREVMQLPESHLTGLAFAQDPETIVVAKADSRTKTVVATPEYDRIIETILVGGFDIVIVDPFAETFAGDENSNSELKWAGVLWRKVARRTNCAVLLVHHTKKYAQDMAGDMDAGRGGGSLPGIARMVGTLFPMTTKEFDAFKKTDKTVTDRSRYIRYDDAKANLTLVTFAARWFKKHSYILPNGSATEPPDEVGVLEPWAAPDPLSGLSNEIVTKIFRAIETGVIDKTGRPTGDLYSDHANSKDRWVIPIVQDFFDCDDAQAKGLVTTWIDNGMLELVEVEMPSAKGGKRKGLKVKAYPGITERSDQMDLLR